MTLVDICFDSALVVFRCEACDDGLRDPRHSDAWCSNCDGAGQVPFYLGTLLANLAIAGGIALAFELGGDLHEYEASPWLRDLRGQQAWRPNVEGKQAPGWSKP